jgi:chromosome segregation ATPase
MAEQLNFQINIGGQERTVNTIRELKQAIKEAEFEALKLSQQYGETDTRVIALRKQIGTLKETIQDSAEATANFSKGAGAFPAISKAIQGLAGGFAAVQGAIGLVGVESKEVEKQLLKVQSALALSQGLEQLFQAKDAFVNLAGIIKGGVVQAFTALRAAIGATGIGLLVISLGTIIAYWDKIVAKFKESFPVLSKLGEYIGDVVNSVTDFVGLTSEAERNLDKLEKAIKLTNKSYENTIRLLESQGGKEKEIYEKRQEIIDNDIKLLNEKRKVNGKLTEEEQQQLNDLEVQRIINFNNEQERLRKLEKQRKDKIDAEIKESREALQTANENAVQSRLEGEDLELRQLLDKYKKQRELYKDNQIALKNIEEAYAIERQTIVDKYTKQRTDAEGKAAQDAIDNIEATTEADGKSTQQQVFNVLELGNKKRIQTEEDKKKAQEKRDAEVRFAQDTLSIIGGFIDQNSAAGKAIAIAQAIINTYQGASKALAQGGIFGPVAAAASIAAGFVQVRKIMTTKVPSAKGQGTVPEMSMSVGGSAPLSPELPTASVTALNQETINALGNQAIRAYVVETDMTTNQQRIQAIKQRARFG